MSSPSDRAASSHAASPAVDGAGAPFPAECAGFLSGRGFRLEGMLGGYAFRSPTDMRVIAVDGSGARVVSLGDELTVWDAASGKRAAVFPFSGEALAVATDGRTAVVGQRTGSILSVDLATGAERWHVPLTRHDEGSLAAGIAPPVSGLAMAGGVLAAVLQTGAHVHLVRDRRIVRSLPGRGPVTLSPDGSLLVAGPCVHDVASGAVLHTFEAGAAPSSLGYGTAPASRPTGRGSRT